MAFALTIIVLSSPQSHLLETLCRCWISMARGKLLRSVLKYRNILRTPLDPMSTHHRVCSFFWVVSVRLREHCRTLGIWRNPRAHTPSETCFYSLSMLLAKSFLIGRSFWAQPGTDDSLSRLSVAPQTILRSEVFLYAPFYSLACYSWPIFTPIAALLLNQRTLEWQIHTSRF